MRFTRRRKRRFRAFSRRHVTTYKDATQFFSDMATALFIQVENRNLGASGRQCTGRTFTQTGCTTGNNCGYVFEIHNTLTLVIRVAANMRQRLIRE
jgi:hypothetical protein